MSRRNFHSDKDYLVQALGFTPEELAVSLREDELSQDIEKRLGQAEARGRNDGRREEGARIRRELLDAINQWSLTVDLAGHVGDRAMPIRLTPKRPPFNDLHDSAHSVSIYPVDAHREAA